MIRLGAALLLVGLWSAACASRSAQKERVRVIILGCQHPGAHGLGYGERSRRELSQRLSPADVPALLELHAERYGDVPEIMNVRVGVQFALAALCAPGLEAVVDGARRGAWEELDAVNTLTLIKDFDGCDAATRRKAESAIPAVQASWKGGLERLKRQSAENAAADARVQANGLKRLDPGSVKTLTRAEREEAFSRSARAAGLDGPRTPAQETLYQRMYKTMVLGESDPSKNTP